MPLRLVRVLPDLAAVPRRFDYAVPEALKDAVQIGTRVRVELHGRRVTGWVVEDSVAPTPGVIAKPLLGVSSLGPPASVVALAEWAAWRWAGPLAPLLKTASSTRVVRSLPTPPSGRVLSRRDADATGANDRSPRHPWPGSCPGPGELVEGIDQRELWRALQGAGGAAVVRVPPLRDLLPIVVALSSWCDGPLLVLVPNSGWAECLTSRLNARGWRATRDWAEAAAGWPIVVGSRAGAFAPLSRIGAAVVLDAHDESFREERAPCYDAPSVVVERARRDGAPCVLVSACPTVTLSAGRVVIAPRGGSERAGWPVVTVVDRRGADPRTGWFSEEFVRLARRVLAASPGDERATLPAPRALSQSEQAPQGATSAGAAGAGRFGPVPAVPLVVVFNRLGRASLLACAACGELAYCERCWRPLEEAAPTAPGPRGSAGAAGGLRCRSCGAERPKVCAGCGGLRLKVLRPGVTRIREELEALLGVSVLEVTASTRRGPHPVAGAAQGGGTARGDGVAVALDSAGASLARARVVVGTEAVLHRVRRASAVAFLDFDQHLLAPRFGAAEQALALLAKAGRLVGPRGSALRGQVLVQTRLPDHETLVAAVRGDPEVLARRERRVRAELALPPTTALATVEGETGGEFVTGLGCEYSALGERRWLVRAPDHVTLCDALAREAQSASGRLRIVVDPIDV